LRPESAFTFPEQTPRFQRESHEPVQNLLNRMKDVILKRFQLLEPRGSSVSAPISYEPSKCRDVYFRGLPRFAKINPRASAVQRSRLATLSASLRSGPGAIRRASSSASAARVSQSSRSGERRVSLLNA
jgi:hypothetical protein